MRLGSMMFPQSKTLAPSAPKPTLKELSTSATTATGKGLAAVNGTGEVKRKPGEFKIEWPKMPVQQAKDYRVITKAADFIEYAKKCALTGYASFDYETAPSDDERERWARYQADYQKRNEDLERRRLDAIADATEQYDEGKERDKAVKAAEKEYDALQRELEAEYKKEEKYFQEAPLDPNRCKICTASISALPHESRVIFIDHKAGRQNFEPGLSRDSARKLFMDILDRQIFANDKTLKIAYNLSFETKQSASHGKYISMPVADPFLMLIRCLQVVAPSKVRDDEDAYKGKGLKAMTREYFGVVMTEFKKLLGKLEVAFFDEISTDDPDAVLYSAEDSDYGLQQYLYWVEVAKQIPGYYDWLHRIEMPFMRVIGIMEYWGMNWDVQKAQQKREEAAAKQATYQEDIRQLAKQYFNLDINPGKAGKTDDTRYLVFDVMKLPAASWSDKTKDPKMDKEAILDMIFMLENNLVDLKEEEYLAVPLPDDWESRDPETDRYLSLDERQAIRIKKRDPHPYKDVGIQLLKIMQKIQKYATLLSSHVDGREKYRNPVTGRIHHNYGVWTETSRTNCYHPNGQNVPRADHDDLGVRTMYIPGQDKRFFFIDYSGFELRLMGWKCLIYAEDGTLIDIFVHNGDVHKRTASKATGKPEAEITKHERSSAKPANFGICYGGTEYALQVVFKVELDTRVSLQECRRLVDAVKEAYPGIPVFQRKVVLEAREQGYVATIFGYIRLLQHISSANNWARSKDERRAANTPIQGSAADIMKAAQNRVYDKTAADSREYFQRLDDGITERGALMGLVLVHGHTDMVAQIHDEIIFEFDNDDGLTRRAADWVKATMEQPPLPDFPVPIIAEASLGFDCWGDKVDYEKWVKQLAEKQRKTE